MPLSNRVSLRERAHRLKRDTLAVWYASFDRRTPWYARLLAGLVAAYAFSPVDLVPDFIPVLGYLDDLILIPAGIALLLRLIPAEVMSEARLKAETAAVKPVNWWMGALVLLVWGVLLFLVLRAGWRWIARE